MSEKNTRVILRIEKREIKPKPSRRCRIRCPPPLLPAAPSHRQSSSQSLLSPPVFAAPPRPQLPRIGATHWERRHAASTLRCPFQGRACWCCRLVIVVAAVVVIAADVAHRLCCLLPSPLLLSSSSSSPRPPRPPLPPPLIMSSTRSP